MKRITESEYNAKPRSSRDVWTTERDDWPDWPQIRHLHMGKRTMLDYDPKYGTVLLIEGMGFEIVPDDRASPSLV